MATDWRSRGSIVAGMLGCLALVCGADRASAQAFDPTFQEASTNGFVWALAVQPDGKILVGGAFTEVGGVPKESLARLNADGSVDGTFTASVAGTVQAIGLLPDGRIMIGGSFGQVGGVARTRLARLMPNGTLDASFNVAFEAQTTVEALLVQPDGRIVIGGDFVRVNGVVRARIARLNADGTLDAGMSSGVTAPVSALARQADGSLLLGLRSESGADPLLQRYGPTGVRDPSFTPFIFSIYTFDPSTAVRDIDVRPDGRIAIVGKFDLIGNDQRRDGVAQFHPDGTLDTTFQPPRAGSRSYPETTALQADGRLLVGRQGDTVMQGLARVLVSGALDPSFGPPTDGVPALPHAVDVALQTDGRILAAFFTGSTCWLARLLPAPPAGDTDVDGLPDEWEVRFGLDPTSSIDSNGAGGDPDGDGRTNAQERAAGTHPKGTHVAYLAEGAFNQFFSARLAALNVGNPTSHLLFTFLQPGGAVDSHAAALPRYQRFTLGGSVLGALESSDFSTVLESDQPIVLDRTMGWNGGVGSHAETAVPSPASTWYLAEGSTSGDFALFYLLQNPNPVATVATIRYLLPFGQAPITRTYALAANSRTTIPVDAQGPSLASTDVSAVITTPQGVPIIVERAMYRSTAATAFAAGHGAAGVTAPATSWFLAEGATGPFFDCFILLANPGTQAATVAIDYLLSDGRTFTKQYTVPAEGRFTIWVDNEEIVAGSGVRPLDNVAVSSTVTANVPIIVERTMWWPGPALGPDFWTEAHNSPGATTTGTVWALAEGEIGGAEGAETYVLIANTSATPGMARVWLHYENGSLSLKTVPLLPRSRRNVSIATDFQFPVGASIRFSMLIESLADGGNPAAQLVVERAMYTSPGGRIWEAGTNALATRLSP